mmetsp:Transcript_61458/g.163582  ORF Transcript_61458/g.163582 Transcript_61458/m.163582 type:complete len:261 (+) Transcript_61458:2457-3239(+)
MLPKHGRECNPINLKTRLPELSERRYKDLNVVSYSPWMPHRLNKLGGPSFITSGRERIQGIPWTDLQHNGRFHRQNLLEAPPPQHRIPHVFHPVRPILQLGWVEPITTVVRSCWHRRTANPHRHILERLGSFQNERRMKGLGNPQSCALPLCLLELFLDCFDRENFARQDRVSRRVQSSKPDTRSFTVSYCVKLVLCPINHREHCSVYAQGLDGFRASRNQSQTVLQREHASNHSCCVLAERMPSHYCRGHTNRKIQLSN